MYLYNWAISVAESSLNWSSTQNLSCSCLINHDRKPIRFFKLQKTITVLLQPFVCRDLRITQVRSLAELSFRPEWLHRIRNCRLYSLKTDCCSCSERRWKSATTPTIGKTCSEFGWSLIPINTDFPMASSGFVNPKAFTFRNIWHYKSPFMKPAIQQGKPIYFL